MFSESKHLLTRLEKFKNSRKTNAQDLIFTKNNKKSVFNMFCDEMPLLKKDVQ